jgi:hypothetical protein
MPIAALYANTITVGATEVSLVSNSTTLSNDTNVGMYQIWLDLSALTATEEIEIKVLEKVIVGGTKRIVYHASYFGPIPVPNFPIPSLILMNGWDATLKKIAGSDRAVDYSIRRVS